jgi:hypothetical protein
MPDFTPNQHTCSLGESFVCVCVVLGFELRVLLYQPTQVFFDTQLSLFEGLCSQMVASRDAAHSAHFSRPKCPKTEGFE